MSMISEMNIVSAIRKIYKRNDLYTLYL